ncbi:MAG: DUF5682 family protein [Gordonia sp. (in: high G+C Gram-positive bacteria)]
MSEVSVLGIRHHGPGSARAVVAELDRLTPDVVLIEGPADGSDLIAQIAGEGMAPPVALLAYAADDPAKAAFWPFAVFSPEWQALRWAVTRGVDVEFCDLPAAQTLAHRAAREEPAPPDDDEDPLVLARSDPIALLAAAAGCDDPERWWDDVVEARGDGGGFAAITEAMAAVREEIGGTARTESEQIHEQRREAHMRQVLRKAGKRPGVERVAVVCGAWHAPALSGKLPPANHDLAVLRGAPKLRAKLAWVPWTHSRLAVAGGYAAGVISPGWYHHLFTTESDVIVRWLIHQANVLRDKDIDVSSAHIIETARLAETLAVMRGRPLAGLAEISEATLAVMCEGNETLAQLLSAEAVIGERLGAVPEDAPVVPLQADLIARARSARLKLSPVVKELVIDLRRPADRAKSLLLHRLAILGIEWGVPRGVSGAGTFKEGWLLAWQPEFVVEVVMASVWGTTVAGAAASRVSDRARSATSLAEITAALEAALLADLPDAVPVILGALAERAAVDHDVEHLMAALPALSRARRYGDVRGTDLGALGSVASALLVRVCVGLPAAVTGLNDEAATVLQRRVDAVHETVALFDPDDQDRWITALRSIADRSEVNGVLVGRATRLLLDGGQLTSADAARRLGYALSGGATPAAKAAWIEGFLGAGGLLLVHDRDLLAVLDGWLVGLSERDFVDVLPLLRRTFGLFEPAVRRNIGERVAGLGRAEVLAAATTFDAELAAPAVAVVANLLGLP